MSADAGGVQVIKNRAGVLQRHGASRLLVCIALKRRTLVYDCMALRSAAGHAHFVRAFLPPRTRPPEQSETLHTSTCFVEELGDPPVPPVSSSYIGTGGTGGTGGYAKKTKDLRAVALPDFWFEKNLLTPPVPPVPPVPPLTASSRFFVSL